MEVCPLADSALVIPAFNWSSVILLQQHPVSICQVLNYIKIFNCLTITLDILDMGQDSQTARTQHLFFITFPLPA